MNRKVALTASLMAFLMGTVTFFATLSLTDLSIPIALVVAALGGYYLIQIDDINQTLSSGFYINALLIFITPVSLFLPLFVGMGDLSVLASLYGLFVSGLVALVLTVVFVAAGRFFSKRAAPPE